MATSGPTRPLLELLDGRRDSAFLARRTIRELSENATFGHFESGPLHNARTLSLLRYDVTANADVRRTLRATAINPMWAGARLAEDLKRMIDTGYLDGAPGWP